MIDHEARKQIKDIAELLNLACKNIANQGEAIENLGESMRDLADIIKSIVEDLEVLNENNRRH